MLASITANWLLRLKIGPTGKESEGKHGRHGPIGQDVKRSGNNALLVLAIIFNIAVISFFKYEGFVAGIINSIAGAQVVPDLELPLPIGSICTLQALDYVINVYRGQAPPQICLDLAGANAALLS